MENIEFVYTYGMDESDIESHLSEKDVGVLSLCRDGETYAVPISYHYDGGELYLRMGEGHGGEGDKFAFAEETETATFVVFDAGEASWSIVARGTLSESTARQIEEFDPQTLNQMFDAFRIFDQEVDEVDIRVFKLEIDEITGRMEHP